MADSAVVGILRAMLTADTAQFDAGMRKATQTTEATGKKFQGLGQQMARLTPQAERMFKAFQGDKQLYTANSLVQAITKLGGATRLTETEQARANRTLSDAIAKYRALGQTAPKAMLDLERATRRAHAPADMLQAKMLAIGAAVGTMVGTFVSQLVGRGVRALIDLSREAVSTAGKFVDLSNKTGLSTEALQRMDHVAAQTGTTLDAMSEAAFRLGVRLAGGGASVTRAVQELGLEWTKLRAMRPDQQFETVVNALSTMEDAQERNRLGVELFGRSFSTIASAVASGYAQMASEAKVSSDAQLRSLDRLGDKWDEFVKNQKAGLRSFLGQLVIAAEEFQKLSVGELFKVGAGIVSGNPAMAFITELNRIAAKRPQDIFLKKEVEEAAKSVESYTAQLAKVREELARLTPEQRKEIEAAQQLGVSTDDLEDKYGLTEGALRLLNTQTKGYEASLKKSTKANEEAAAAEDKKRKAYQEFTNFVEERRIEDVERMQKARTAEAKDLIAGLQQRQAVRDEDARKERELTNFIEERRLETEGARIKQLEEFLRTQQEHRDRFKAMWRDGFLDVSQAFSQGIGRMLVGLDKFKDGWIGIWNSIRQSFANVLGRMLDDFIGNFLGGMFRGLSGGKFGQLAGSSLTGGLSTAALGGVGAATLFGGGAASASVTSAAAIAAAGGGTGVATGGGGALAGVGGFLTNPWTIGIGAGILAALGIKKLFGGPSEAYKARELQGDWQRSIGDAGLRLVQMLFNMRKISKALLDSLFDPTSRDAFKTSVRQLNPILSKHGGSSFVRPMNLGGFIPRGVQQLALLHGPEWVIPERQMSQLHGGPRQIINQYISIEGMVSMETAEEFRRKILVPLQRRAYDLNTDFQTTHLKGALA